MEHLATNKINVGNAKIRQQGSSNPERHNTCPDADIRFAVRRTVSEIMSTYTF
jgi:hypothetical protein